ncbi:MAG: U32 family peptidase [Clostridia bacterium]|nr:U32 family peptidase [Clostridia bacterium]
MNNNIVLPEILSPAGNFEKMKAAERFGADAVYLAGREFGMRSAADNFSVGELMDAVEYMHLRGKKVYLTVNTLPRGDEYPRLREFLSDISGFGIDGFICADLGVIALIKELIPDGEIHISTQASICSPAAAKAYCALGARRLVLARELSLKEIKDIRDAIPDDVDLECFVHGSMCVSWSGRCMLSNMLVGRDANRGACAQPCRWNYTVYEEKRPDTPIPIEENALGTFIMSSKDMCMIEHVGELAEAGITSFKIEGRIKSVYYTAVVTNAYRMALNALSLHIKAGGKASDFRPDPLILNELMSVSHREYCTGFYFDSPTDNPQLVSVPGYVRDKAYLAVAGEQSPDDGSDGSLLYSFTQRNKFSVGDRAELLTPGRPGRAFTVTEIYDEEGNRVESAPHPLQKIRVSVPFRVLEGDILRAGDPD